MLQKKKTRKNFQLYQIRYAIDKQMKYLKRMETREKLIKSISYNSLWLIFRWFYIFILYTEMQHCEVHT